MVPTHVRNRRSYMNLELKVPTSPRLRGRSPLAIQSASLAQVPLGTASLWNGVAKARPSPPRGRRGRLFMSPSPLNGERAGVRGENGPARFMVPTRVRIRRSTLSMNLLRSLTFNIQLSTFNVQLMRRALKVERWMLKVESSRLTHPGSWSQHTSEIGGPT